MDDMDVQGYADARFGPVRDCFADVVRAQPGTGAGLAAWCDGRLAVDLWVLGSPLESWTGGSSSLLGQIDRHVLRNPGDWSAEDLFERLGAFEAGHTRFGRFLEGLASADVIPDELVSPVAPLVRNPEVSTAVH